MTRETVDVPETFRRLGYSGLFRMEVDLVGEGSWTHEPPPCLLPGKWLLLTIDTQARTAVVVRNDLDAVGDMAGLR